VNGNRTNTTSPNLKGIVSVVFGVSPDSFERGSAQRFRSLSETAILCANSKELDKTLDLGDLFGAECPDSLAQDG